MTKQVQDSFSKVKAKLKKVVLKYQNLGRIMNIDEIADVMEGKTIEDVRVVYGEDTLIIYLSDGSSIEIIVDSIYADIPEFDS